MPILAAPLVIPFAEAIGLSVAVLGMAKIGDEVNKYIEKYPEESMKILSTIVPGVGIGEIFMNKEDSGDDEEVEVEEDTRSKKEIVLGELAKDKGNYSDEDAEGKYASKRGRIIRALEDAGKVNPDKEYNPEKKYQGYKRFLKKADGGSIGIEVLFGPKVPAAPSQLVEESDIVLGYRGDAAYRSGSEQSKSIGQGNVGSKASFGGGQGVDRSGRSEGAGGADRSRITQQQTRNQNANNFLNKIKKANPPGKSPFQKFLAHDRFTDMMKVSKTPNYHQMGGLDFMARFPDIDPDIAKGLASAYQTIVEGGRAIADGPGGYTLKDASKKAAEEARLNKIGIDDYFDPNSKTYKQYTSEDFGLKPAAVQMADGGRVGLFMGGDPLTGQALAIYNSMNSYGFSDQEIANALEGQGLYTPSGSSTPETTAPNIINQQLQTGGGGDNNFGGPGIGDFGNLDPNTLETMQVEVADGMGGTKIKEVDTYLTAGGLRRTLDNKNPVNLGLDIKPMAITIMEALMGKKTDDEFDPAGKIYGTFNNPNYKDLSFFGKIKADYSRQKELKQLQEEFEKQEKLKEQIRQEAIANANKPYSGPTFYNSGNVNTDGGTGGAISQDFKNTTASIDNYSADVLRAKGGMVGYKDGGLATMFTRRR